MAVENKKHRLRRRGQISAGELRWCGSLLPSHSHRSKSSDLHGRLPSIRIGKFEQN